jgi:hypothetical protein
MAAQPVQTLPIGAFVPGQARKSISALSSRSRVWHFCSDGLSMSMVIREKGHTGYRCSKKDICGQS